MPVTKSSTITVLATREEHERIAELIGDLDTSGRSVANMTQRTYRLQFATPGSLVTALESLYQNRRDVRIVPDPQNRSLLVVAPEELQKAIAQLVRETDQEAQGSARVEKVFHPKHVTAASLVPTLSSLYAPPNGNAQFSLHGNGRTVVIVAPAAQHERIAATLKLLDQPDDPETRPVAKVYRLVNTSRDSVVSVLQAVYAGNPRVQVTGGVDPLAVSVVAPNVEQERIAALVQDMDQPAEAGAERTVVSCLGELRGTGHPAAAVAGGTSYRGRGARGLQGLVDCPDEQSQTALLERLPALAQELGYAFDFRAMLA